ncbi:MAG: HIT domain-containing protein [Candidatus Brocadiia bacterium]|nr:MAG: HIT domain-containing protein [Candidatus Brocadiia bacterium]
MERQNLWAPWRINYIQGLSGKPGTGECFLCSDLKNPQQDDANFVLWRTKNCIVVLNRFPYNNGHLLVAPVRHVPDLDQAQDEELLEMMKLIRACQQALSATIKPHGFNMGMNFGRCAGAGLPGHLHAHVVPRWDGDTNFMHVCSDTDVISQSMTELLSLLKKVSIEKNLPGNF